MLTDSVGGNLDRYREHFASAPLAPGPSAGRWKGWVHAGGGCWLLARGRYQFSPCVISSHGQLLAFSQHGQNQTKTIFVLMIKPQKSCSIISPAFYSLRRLNPVQIQGEEKQTRPLDEEKQGSRKAHGLKILV